MFVCAVSESGLVSFKHQAIEGSKVHKNLTSKVLSKTQSQNQHTRVLSSLCVQGSCKRMLNTFDITDQTERGFDSTPEPV